MLQNTLSNKSFYFVSLGCSKNLVDSQVMLGQIDRSGFNIVTQADQADAIIINTCSFIEAAKVESIDTILELASFKKSGKCKALVVSGCLAQRYSSELEKELPEVDLFIGTGEYHRILTHLESFEEGTLSKKSFVEIPKFIHSEFDPRINTSPFYTAWLKVSEGCNRKCSFCIIPKLRGELRSRSVSSLVTEAVNLRDTGVREFNLISQDLSDYGSDFETKSTKGPIYDLLDQLSLIEGVDWIRPFYFYPDDLTVEVMQLMAERKSICSYLDMPIQHFSDKVLKRMNRKVTGEQIHSKIKRLREFIPNIFLRTSVIVGFPGETEEDFQILLSGVKKSKFNHLGVFKYSDEEDTPAYRLKEKVPAEIIDERYNLIYQAQKEISAQLNQSLIGQTLEVIIEGPHEETDLLLQGRHIGQAPDIDGKVIINDGSAQIGEIVKVEITDSHEYDLVGKIIV